MNQRQTRRLMPLLLFGLLAVSVPASGTTSTVSLSTKFPHPFLRSTEQAGMSTSSLNPLAGPTHAFLWEHGVMSDLGTLGGAASTASDINDRGQVAGASETADGESHACVWENGMPRDLGTLDGHTSSFANAINNAGDVVGWSGDRGFGYDSNAVLWRRGSVIEIARRTGSSGSAAAIDVNDRGQVLGVATGIGYFVWQDGVLDVLNAPDGYRIGGVTALNNRGDVVGYGDVQGVFHAFLWQEGSFQDLGSLGGANWGALCINDKGQVAAVVERSDFGFDLIVWDRGSTTNLGDIGSALPTDINIQGAITLQRSTAYPGTPCSPADGENGLLWQRGAFTELENLGGDGSSAHAINARGQVIGASRTPWTRPPQSPVAHHWSKAFTSDATFASRSAIAADSEGNVILAGFYKGSIDLGGGPVSNPYAEGFLAKFGPTGDHKWSIAIPELAFLSRPVIDPNGNVITGSLGTLRKYSPDGFGLWSKPYGAALAGLAVDPDGSILSLGYFKGTATIGTEFLSAGASDYTTVVAKFASDGRNLWTRSFSTSDEGDVVGDAVAVDPTGKVLFTGHVSGTVDFGGGATVPVGDSDAYMCMYDRDGNYVWTKRFGRTLPTYNASDAAFDGQGNIFTTFFRHAGAGIDLGDGRTEPALVAKFDSEGILLWKFWAECGGNQNQPDPLGLATDQSGNVVLLSNFSGTVSLGAEPLVGAGRDDLFVTKLDASGNLLWNARYGSADWDRGTDIAVDPDGRVLITGNFTGGIDFGGGDIDIGTDWGIFVAQLGDPGSESAVWRAADDDVPPRSLDARAIQWSGSRFKARTGVLAGPTGIRYQLAAQGPVRLRVFDVRGRLVMTLVDGVQSAGNHEIAWDARDIPSGVYFARFEAEGLTETVRVVRLK